MNQLLIADVRLLIEEVLLRRSDERFTYWSESSLRQSAIGH